MINISALLSLKNYFNQHNLCNLFDSSYNFVNIKLAYLCPLKVMSTCWSCSINPVWSLTKAESYKIIVYNLTVHLFF